MRGFVSLQMWRNAVASLDFTSSLYLGIRHPYAALAPWVGLTLGKPSALEPVPGGAALAVGVARLQGWKLGSSDRRRFISSGISSQPWHD
jgi:hypothetical protein